MTTFPGSPRTLRGALVVVDPDTRALAVLPFQYNPHTLTRAFEIRGTAGGLESDDVWSRVLGQTLEVVPSSDPARLRAGDQLRVIILLRGAPLAGASVGVWSRDAAGAHTRELRSDSRGEVTIDVDRAGDWAVRLVHMERCRVDCAAVEWESTWASFVFGVRAGRAEGAPPREVGRAR
ncbi:MAG: DUF4198 domain-containing protein [Myxococcota bacterium]|nr:DUF4198 domain-containing protein [Myxococcota bacterium]